MGRGKRRGSAGGGGAVRRGQALRRRLGAAKRRRGRRANAASGRPPREAVAELIAEQLGFRGFPARVEAEAEHAALEAARLPGERRDLTELATFTVDPASARDFDDAVSAQREGDGARLWIHIADVAAHVRPGSPLDQEARRRANSTYVPGAVEPMLPHALSSDACSLAPGVERLAVTAEIELGPEMRPRRARFYRSLIRSDARLDYDELDEIFAGRERAPEDVAEPLAAAREVAAALGEQRRATELGGRIGRAGVRVRRRGRSDRRPPGRADRVAPADRAADDPHQRAGRPVPRRAAGAGDLPGPCAARPAADRTRCWSSWRRSGSRPRRSAAASRRGRRERSRRRRAGWSLAEARRRGHGRAAYISLVLRSLKQAAYSERNSGHAGLGSEAYAHFTSPIRRYPDLVVHRALLAALGEGEDAPSLRSCRDAAADSSARERDSAKIERGADDVCAAYLLERELGERGLDAEFEGEVSGVIRAGAFVTFGGELGDVYEGMLPARTLPGERYELDRAEVALVGRGEGGRTVRLGDQVKVRVTGVDSCPRPLRPLAGSARGRGGGWRRRKKKRPPASGDVVTNRRARHKFELVETNGGGDRPQRLRGEVAARRQGADDRRLRRRRRRRGLAAQPPHPSLRVLAGRRPRSRRGRANCCCTATRSSG